MMCESEISQCKVVTVGGGTGQFTFLRGLVKLNNPEFNTAVVGTWDSGSISGQLRVKEGILPPGDYIQCIFGMMENDEQLREAIIILRDRSEGHPLVHAMAAQAEKSHHGVEGGIDGLRNLFRVRGKVLPVSLIDTDLNTETKCGAHYDQEHKLDELEDDPNFFVGDEVSRVYLQPEAPANPRVLQVIRDTEKIIFPPGSPYGSIFPHLLVKDVSETILNASGKLILVLNLMTTRGQDHHLTTASRWLKVFQYYLGDNEWIKHHGKSRIDYLVANENHIDPEIVDIYQRKGQKLIEIDERGVEDCIKMAPGLRIIRKNLADYDRTSHLLRHNPIELVGTVLALD